MEKNWADGTLEGWSAKPFFSVVVFVVVVCFQNKTLSKEGFCFFVLLKQGFSVQSWLFWNLLYRPDWPRTH